MISQNLHSRREFNRLASAALVSAGMGSIPINLSAETKKYIVPTSPRNVNTEQTVKALASNVPAGKGEYVPHFIDAANAVHFKRYGKSYQDYVVSLAEVPDNVKRFASNPLEVLIEDEFARNTSEGIIGGYFEHANSPKTPHRVHLDSSLTPSTLFFSLFHELSHLFIGLNEPLAHVYTHRSISDAVALFPSLLMEKDEQCPLTQLMLFYRGKIQATKQSLTFSMQPEHLAYLTLLHSNINTGTVIDVGNAFDFLARQGTPMYSQILSKALPLFNSNQDFAPDIIKDFATKTEQYILRQNPSMPADKMALLRRKMEKIASMPN